MGLFQSAILKKYMKGIEEKVSVPYRQYTAYFHNPDIQENIRNSKEEQFQEGFLRELFVKILGYTLNPDANYSLITEKKNESNSKKADGAILVNGDVVGVIELKDGKTTDLKQVETQAFGYKNYHRKASYVIISNFEKLRFYIDNAIDFIEFNLFSLSREDFAVLWLCLNYQNIASNLPKQIKAESVSNEDQVTRQLYKEYSVFKRALFEDLTKLNPTYDRLTLFKKSQKLLDRLLFILFAEYSGLLPPNSIVEIIRQWETLKELDEYKPLYDRLKKYFGYMNSGFRGKKHDIFAYNGGLFKPDDVLDNIQISDDALYPHLLSISRYDFSSEVDVNILGHIFENSLTEIDEITNAITTNSDLKTTNKRKKDGVFYTPRYITAYIVENTLGKLCIDKKATLEIDESEYFADKKRQVTTKKKLDEKLKNYRQWLLDLTICDPACGSGAFLNAALDFLMTEHRLIDEMYAKIYRVPMVLPDIENSILENNLYGVDINEESVEIAKLSLWLRTAKPNRKLNSLNDNIKCGNSLISDPAVAGEKAFDWHEEFPQVFEKGGFDVVIGNPPYIPTEYISPRDKKYLESNYKSAFGRINLYPIFYEKGIILLKNNGLLGFITPYTILKNQYYIEARRYIIENSKLLELIDFKGISVFQEAAVDSIILILKKEISRDHNVKQVSQIVSFENKEYKTDFFNIREVENREDLSMLISENDCFIGKLHKNTIQLKEIINFSQGIITGGNSKFLTTEKSGLAEKVITGSDFNRYCLKHDNTFIIYDVVKLHRPRKREIFEVKEKILLRQTGAYPICTIDISQYFTLDTVHNGILINNKFNLRYLLVLLNSKLMRFLYESSINESGKVFAQVKIIYVDPLPIKNISSEAQHPFIEKADQMLSLNTDLQTKRQRFRQRLSDNFDKIKLNTALERFDELDFAGFVKELLKQKIKLSLKQQDEWEEYFNAYKTECNALSAQITATDKTIDEMVYGLYGLTEEEIKIIEK
jgi:hypothetical protein